MRKKDRYERLLGSSGLLAGVAVASLLAGCGGGGGGGGGGSAPTSSAQVVAGPTTIPANDPNAVTVGNAAPTNGQAATAEVDVPADAVPSNLSSVTITVATDPSAPAVGANVRAAAGSASPRTSTTMTLDSTVYDIEPANTPNFQNGGITIKIPYTPDSSGVNPLIYYYDATTSEWTVVPSTGSGDQYHTSPDYVSVQTNLIEPGRGANGAGPTDYAVLGVAPPPVPSPPPSS